MLEGKKGEHTFTRRQSSPYTASLAALLANSNFNQLKTNSVLVI